MKAKVLWHRGPLLRCLNSITPRHEFVQTRDFVVGDIGESPNEPCLWIDPVKFGGLNQGICLNGSVALV